MSGVLNDCDALLQAAVVRVTANALAAQVQQALDDAAAAQEDADAALLKLADIESDGKLTPGEKPAAVAARDAIIAEQGGIEAQATALGVTTEKTAYTAAVTALTTYLATAPLTGWSTIPGAAVTITGTEFRDKFKAVYTARQALLNAMAAAAATKADWTSLAGVPLSALTRAALGSMHSGGHGDVRFVLNQNYLGNPNDGEIRILGTKFYHPDGTARVIVNATELPTVFEAGAVVEADPFFIIYTDTVPNTRFGATSFLNSNTGITGKFFAALYTLATDTWQAVSNDNSRYTFTPAATDCIVAVCRKTPATTGITSLSSLLSVNTNLPADGATVGATWGVNVNGKPDEYRVLCAGGLTGVTLPAAQGLYKNDVFQYGVARSYSMVALRRTDHALVHFQTYDVWGNGSTTAGRNAATLAGDLNYYSNLPSQYIIIVWTGDEPQSLRLTGALPEAMYRNGASRAVFGSPQFKYRSAYCLIGISGCGEGNGSESYQGDADNSTTAWIDLSFTLLKGVLAMGAPGFTPKTLADYSYLGDLDATKGAPAGTTVAGTDAATVRDQAANAVKGGSKPIVSVPGGGMTGSGTTGERGFGSRSVSVSGNFTSPLSYQWSIVGSDTANGYAHSMFLTGGTTGTSVGVGGTTYGANDVIYGEVACTVTDAQGLTGMATFGVNQTFGSGAL